MSEFVGLTPALNVVLRNPLFRKIFPEKGNVLAVIDTGYDGFIACPRDIFESLELDRMELEKRTLITANGEVLGSEGAYGSFDASDGSVSADGFIETYEGVMEVLVGVEALIRTRTLLDYCSMRVKLEAFSG